VFDRELWAPRVGAIGCLAEPAALDRLACPRGALALRVAPDELNLWCAPAVRERVLVDIRDDAVAADPASMTLDVSAGWSARLLLGQDAPAAFRSLVAHDPGEGVTGLVQGAVRGVPARSLLGADFALMLFVSVAVNTFDRVKPAGWRLAGEPAEDGLLARLLDLAPAA
jgi:hypothetical protein